MVWNDDPFNVGNDISFSSMIANVVHSLHNKNSIMYMR